MKPHIRAAVTLFASVGLLVNSAAVASGAVVQRHTIPGWVPYAQGGADINVSVDTVNLHSGTAALRLDFQSPRSGGVFGGIAQAVPVASSTSYTVSGWAKGANVQGPEANRFVLDDLWSQQRFLPDGTFAWSYFEWTFTTAPSQTLIPLMLVGQDTGTLWLDDLSIIKTGTTTNLLANGDFEQWQDRVVIANDALLFEPGDVQISLTSSAATVNWAVDDINGVLVDAGTASTPGGSPAVLDLDALPPGYFTLRLDSGTYYHETSLVVYDGLDALPSAGAPFGVTAHPDYVPDFDMIPALTALGVDRVRFDLRWQHIEPAPGVYVFDQVADYDAIIADLKSNGIRPLVILGYANPLYDGNERPHSNTGRAAYAAYAAAVAERYGDDVDYEIYNEYNHPGGYHLGPCGTELTCYTAMLDEAAAAIRAEAPTATIVLTGLAGLTSWWIGGDTSGHPEWNGIAYDWLEDFLATPSASDIDIVNIHNYSFPDDPEGNNDAVVAAVGDLMAEYPAVASKPLWLTETGWPTMGGAAGSVTEAEQARFVVRDAALSLASGLDEYFVYGMLDDYAEETTEGRFGLFRNLAQHGTLAPKPGFLAFAVMARAIAGTVDVEREALGGDTYSVAFEDGTGKLTRILWSSEPGAVAVATSRPVELTTLLGEQTTLSPVGGVVALATGPDPVYLTGSSISSLATLSTPIYQATAPVNSRQGVAVDVTVAVDLSDGGSASGPVTFTGPGSSTAIVTPVASGRATATLTVPGYAGLGTKSIPVRVTGGGNTLAVLTASTTILENPQIVVQPALAPTTSQVGPLELVINRVGAPGVTLDHVAYTVGGQSASATPGTALPSGVPTAITLPITGVWPWGPVYYEVTATMSDATTRTVRGITSFSAVYPDGTTSVPKADLATSAAWVGTGTGDVTGTMWLSHDTTTVTVHAMINDAVHDPAGTPANLWQGDSIQFAFAADRPGSADPSYSFGAALQGGSPTVYRYSGAAGVESSATATITRDDVNGTTSYTVTLPKSAAGLVGDPERFTYSFLVNDANGSGRAGYREWGSGIGNVVGPSQYLPMVLVPPSIP